MPTVAKGLYDSTALSIARDMASTSSIFDDYIFFKTGDYSYELIVGDIDFEHLTYSNASEYQIMRMIETNPQVSYYQCFRFATLSSGTIHNDAGVLVYSSDKASPQLVDRGGVYLESAILFSIVVLTLYLIINRIFDQVSRR